MTLREGLSRVARALAAEGIEDAALEAEILLRHALDISRVQLYLDLDRDLIPEEAESFHRFVERRLRHEPTAYITGHCEFYGLDFYVDRRVLIPRSATELIVQEALRWAGYRKEPACLIAEVGVGSGIISVALARHLPQARIYASDISAEALEVAGINCRRHRVADRITLLRGDLLRAVPEPVDLVVANLPYIRTGEMAELMPEIRLFEPRIALDGGADGLDRIRELAGQVGDKLRPGGGLLLEIGAGQGKAVTDCLSGLYPSAAVRLVPDWSGMDRVVSLSLPAHRGVGPRLATPAAPGV